MKTKYLCIVRPFVGVSRLSDSFVCRESPWLERVASDGALEKKDSKNMFL